MLAMTRAVDALGIAPGIVLVDGNALPRWGYPARAIVGGDGKCRSIAAASIVAKVARDRMMREADGRHPGYGWATNVGYGTREHQAALARLGPTPLHRRSFAPVAQLEMAFAAAE
jgi:ribonuclease HII